MLKLLLIDDDEELVRELSQVLRAEGFEVDMALDGLQGLRHLQDKQVSNYHFGPEVAGHQWIRRP